jgi:hypothetical protein
MYFTGYVLLSTSDRAGALLWRSLYKEFIEFLAPEYRWIHGQPLPNVSSAIKERRFM